MKRISLSLVVATILVAGCVTRKPLINPEASVPSTASQEQVKNTVREALTHYGWIIDEEKPGATIAHLQQEELFARIQVDYDSKHAVVRHLESKNLKYSKSSSGEEEIHSRYMTWARNISERINNQLHPFTGEVLTPGTGPRK
jgi:hypothetical protein